MTEKEETKKRQNLYETSRRLSAGMDWLDTLGDACARGYYKISDDEKAVLININIKGLKFFKKFQSFTGVTDADL